METYIMTMNTKLRKRIFNVFAEQETLCRMWFCGLALLCCISCGNSGQHHFDSLLTSLAAEDGVVDEDDWQRITAFLDDNKARLPELCPDGEMDAGRVKEYIVDYFKNRRPAMDVEITAARQWLNVRFYLERSGSMIPYDAVQGDGRFKTAIVGLLNALPEADGRCSILVANSEVNDYPEGMQKFLADRDIFKATAGLGDPSYTDFRALFSHILGHTQRGEVSVLVTDLIYSTLDMKGVNRVKVLAEAEATTNATFKGAAKDMAVLVVKMRGSYNGRYFSYNDQQKGTDYNGERPYYFVIAGHQADMARITTDKAYARFVGMESIDGYEAKVLFAPDGFYHPYYSLLLGNAANRGRFRPIRDRENGIHGLHDVEPDRNSGEIRLALAVDMGGMLVDESYLTNPDNYEIASDDSIHIERITRIDSQGASPTDRKLMGQATHLMVLQGKGISRDQQVSIRLKSCMPEWVALSSSSDDSHVGGKRFAHTTFGLDRLLGGMDKAYRKADGSHPCYFSLELRLEQ